MAHAITIKSIETGFSQASNSHFIDVAVEVFDGEESLGVRRFGYPMGTSKEEIVEDLKNQKTTLDSDKEVGIASAQLESELAHANSLKEELTNTQI